MAKKKARIDDSIVLFDVVYEDGTLSSRRRVLAAELDPFAADGNVQTLIAAQDRKIAEVSGRARGAIRSVTRSPV